MARLAERAWAPWVAALAVFVLALALPDWLRFVAAVAMAKGLVVLSLVLMMRAGLVSFGHGLYYGLGAYGAGLGVNLFGLQDAFVLLAFGILAAAAVAAVLGLLLSRYREIFFAMLNLAFSMILYGLLVKSAFLGSTDGFNVPLPTYAGWDPGGDARLVLFALSLVLTCAVAVLVHRYFRSPMGYLGEAVRDNEIRVEYLGCSVRRLVYAKYVASAAIAGAGGALIAFITGHIDPDLAYWTTSGEFVFVAILGGTGSVLAPLAASLLFELLRVYAYAWAPDAWQLVIGVTMLLVILFMPGGIWSLVTRRDEAAR